MLPKPTEISRSAGAKWVIGALRSINISSPPGLKNQITLTCELYSHDTNRPAIRPDFPYSTQFCGSALRIVRRPRSVRQAVAYADHAIYP